MQNFKKNKLKSLRMKGKELSAYVDLFNPSKFIPQSQEDFAANPYLRKATFGSKEEYKKLYSTMSMKYISADSIKKQYVDNNKSIYLPSYKSNVIYYSYGYKIFSVYKFQPPKVSKNFAYKIQDRLIQHIKDNYYGKYWSREYFDIWEARQYQVLGRFKKAKILLKKMLSNNHHNKKQIKEYLRYGITRE